MNFNIIFFIVLSRVVITTVHVGEPWNIEVMTGLTLLVYGLFLTMQQWTIKFSSTPGALLLLGVGILALGVQLTVDTWSTMAPLLQQVTVDWWMLYLFVAALTVAIEEYYARVGQFPRFFPVWFSRKKPSGHTLRVSNEDQKQLPEEYYRFFPYVGINLRESMWFMFLPLSLILNAGLFYGYREAVPSFMFAWAVYTVYDCIIRIINNHLLGEKFYVVHALGMILIVLGTWLTFAGGF